MKRILFGICVACGFSGYAEKNHEMSRPTSEWQLVWADEFNQDGLPDASKWGYEEGFVRNKEPQYYSRARLENTRVEGGATRD